jgi:hypothetical protein
MPMHRKVLLVMHTLPLAPLVDTGHFLILGGLHDSMTPLYYHAMSSRWWPASAAELLCAIMLIMGLLKR